MENNGKANAMETLKTKVLDLKEGWEPPVWTLLVLALWIAVPMAGGSIALYSALMGAPPVVWVLTLVGISSFTYLIYKMVYGFLKTLDEAIPSGGGIEEED